MKHAHILVTVRSRRQRNHAAMFERWLGHHLHPRVRHIIARIERCRASGAPPRVIIAGSPESAPLIRPLLHHALVHYMHWLTVTCRPCRYSLPAFPVSLIASPAPGRVRQCAAIGIPPHSRHLAVISSRNPDHCRGLDIDMALILDADRFPRRKFNLRRMLASVLPAIGPARRSMLIMHGTIHPRARSEPFTAAVRARQEQTDHAPWLIIDTDELTDSTACQPETVILHVPLAHDSPVPLLRAVPLMPSIAPAYVLLSEAAPFPA